MASQASAPARAPQPWLPPKRIHDAALTPAVHEGIELSQIEAERFEGDVADIYLYAIEGKALLGVLSCAACGRLHVQGFDKATFTRATGCHPRLKRSREYALRWHPPSAIPPDIEMRLALPRDSHQADGWHCGDLARWMRKHNLAALTLREEGILRGVLDRYCRSVVFRMALCERLDDFPEPNERKRAMRELLAEVARRHGKGLGAGRVGWARRLEIAARALHHAARHGSLW